MADGLTLMENLPDLYIMPNPAAAHEQLQGI